MGRRRRRCVLKGIGVSSAVAIGSVFVLDRRKIVHPHHHITSEKAGDEILRFEKARDVARTALQAIKDRVDVALEHSHILDAHLMMLDDPMLQQNVEKYISIEMQCAEWALSSTISDIKDRFDGVSDDYFRERRSDVGFVGDRILAAFHGDSDRGVQHVPDDAVVVAHDISPADTLVLLKKKLRGFITEVGGSTSHTAILARAMEIPAVVGATGVLDKVGHGDDIIVDGRAGQAIVCPGRQTLSKYQGIARARDLASEEVLHEVKQPCVTPDGHKVQLLANVELASEVDQVLAYGAEGIGLYRTEFLFLEENLPTERDHLRTYKAVLSAMGKDRKVTLRTFDLGSDKLAPKLRMPVEDNPALGLRACRLGFKHEGLFRKQLRAILKATSVVGGRVMFPMISGVSEMRQVKALLFEEREKLLQQGIEFCAPLEVGAMIELPSAVWVADKLAEECDFFSIGTNDLIQYSLAIDRNNKSVANLYRPLHLSNLRAIAHVVKAAQDAKIDVSLCGEMASDPMCTALCMGLGFDSLSMPPSAVPLVKWIVRRFPLWDAKALLDEAMAKSTIEEIENLAKEALRARVPEIEELLPERDSPGRI
ncbi:MAG: phosphoenolpyruvate--protein phosphotransferase [Deltaproteobacteria bacterium]|nr:phosphoenolpyruvate--protein phosphotransferase [Deltaproteobacteria bacterium]